MGSPMHSTTKSTPLPFVAFIICSTQSPFELLMQSVAPSNLARSNRGCPRSTAKIRAPSAISVAAQSTVARPRGPAPITATKSDLVRCRQHIRRHHVSVLLVASQRDVLRQRVRSVVRVGNPAELSLHPIDQRPKLPPAVSAVSVLRFLARCAITARRDAADQDAVAHRVLLHRRASLHHNADALVAQNDTGLRLRDIAAQNVQVRAANSRLVHFDDHISVELQRRLCHSLPPRWFACAFKHVCHHRVVLHLVHCGVIGV